MRKALPRPGPGPRPPRLRGGRTLKPIDLIPSPRRANRAVRRRTRLWLAIVAGYGLCLAITCIAVRAVAGGPTGTFDADIKRAADRVENANTAARAIDTETAALQRQLDITTSIAHHPDWSVLLAALAQVRGDDILLDGVDISPLKQDPNKPDPAKPDPPKTAAKPVAPGAADKSKPPRRGTGYTVHLTGFARSPGKVFAFARDLETLGPLDGVSIVQTHGARVGNLDTTAFELTGVITDRVESPAPPGARSPAPRATAPAPQGARP